MVESNFGKLADFCCASRRRREIYRSGFSFHSRASRLAICAEVIFGVRYTATQLFDSYSVSMYSFTMYSFTAAFLHCSTIPSAVEPWVALSTSRCFIAR
jgi:hypothetical protein